MDIVLKDYPQTFYRRNGITSEPIPMNGWINPVGNSFIPTGLAEVEIQRRLHMKCELNKLWLKMKIHGLNYEYRILNKEWRSE